MADAEQRTKDMMKMAEAIAVMAEEQAPNFENIPGDVALRMFADAIRRTNAGVDTRLPIQ